jgi:hypothetical protein
VSVLVWSALAVDLAIIFAVTAGDGFVWRLGPVRIAIRDVTNPLYVAVALGGLLVALSWRAPRRRAWALASVAVAVALAGVAVTRDAVRIYPLADIAVLEMYVRDALTGKLLVGPYSRFGWHHPGPAYFYLIAPIYALAGRQPAALAAGAAAIAMVSVALIAWTAARSYASAVSAALLASIALYLARIPDLATSSWNPHVVILPVMAVVVLGGPLASGDLALLPLAVVLASFVAQTHLAPAPVVGAVMIVSLVAGLASARWGGPVIHDTQDTRDRHVRPVGQSRRAIRLALWLLPVMWFFPIAEQAAHAPGNLTLLWRFFVSAPGIGQPLPVAAAAWATMLEGPLRPAIALGAGNLFTAPSPGRALLVAIAQLTALLAVGVWSARKGHRSLAWLAALALLSSSVGLWSVTRIQDRIVEHEIFWLTGLGAVNLGVIGGAAALQASRLARMLERGAPIVHGLLVAGCVLLCLTQLTRAREGRLPVTLASPIAGELGTRVREYLRDAGAERPVFRIGEEVWGTAAGMLLELNRAGVRFAVESSWLSMFPQSFAATGDETVEITVSNTTAHINVAGRPGNVVIVSADGIYVDALRTARGPR